MHVLLALLLSLGVAGCTTTFTAERPVDYYATLPGAASDDASLFAADAAVLGDDEIARILEHRYSAPPLSRVALLPLGLDAWSGWSEEMALSVAAVDAQVLDALRASPRIYDASFLPSILVPEQRTVPYLREAAARYQADLLLAFRPACRSYQRYRLFQSEQSRAYCSVEAVLLDVRTGLVPFIAASTRNLDAAEDDADFDFQETVLRTELTALGAALGEIAEAVTEFVGRSGS